MYQYLRTFLTQLSSSLFDPLATKPEFVSTFPVRNHPDKDIIVSRVREYFLTHWPWPSQHLKEGYRKALLEEYSTHVSRAGPLDRNSLHCKFSFFLYDDLIDSQGPGKISEHMAANIFRILEGTDIPDDLSREEVIGRDVCNEMRAIGGAEHLFAEACDWLKIAQAEKGGRDSAMASFDAYVAYRLRDIGGSIAIESALWAREIEVSDRLRADPEIRALQQIANAHLILVNDLYSYRKEKHEDDNKEGPVDDVIFNSIVVLQQSHGLSASQALRDLKRRIWEYESQFREAYEDVKKKYHSSAEDIKAIEDFAGVWMDLMGGNALWSSYCGRYNNF